MQVGLNHFKTEIYEQIKDRSTPAIILLVDLERNGEAINCALVKSIVEMYESMGMGNLDLYINDLEQPLLDSVRLHYDQLVHQEYSEVEFWKMTNLALEEVDTSTVLECLNEATKSKVWEIVQDNVVEAALWRVAGHFGLNDDLTGNIFEYISSTPQS